MSSRKKNPFIQIKDKLKNELYIVSKPIMDDLVKASYFAILNHPLPPTYDSRLVTVARYDNGHFLIYDKHQVLAYTIIMK